MWFQKGSGGPSHPPGNPPAPRFEVVVRSGPHRVTLLHGAQRPTAYARAKHEANARTGTVFLRNQRTGTLELVRPDPFPPDGPAAA